MLDIFRNDGFLNCVLYANIKVSKSLTLLLNFSLLQVLHAFYKYFIKGFACPLNLTRLSIWLGPFTYSFIVEPSFLSSDS